MVHSKSETNSLGGIYNGVRNMVQSPLQPKLAPSQGSSSQTLAASLLGQRRASASVLASPQMEGHAVSSSQATAVVVQKKRTRNVVYRVTPE